MFKDELLKDPLASRRIELAVVTFDSEVRIIQDFVTADRFQAPVLAARGSTCMGSGIHEACGVSRGGCGGRGHALSEPNRRVHARQTHRAELCGNVAFHRI